MSEPLKFEVRGSPAGSAPPQPPPKSPAVAGAAAPATLPDRSTKPAGASSIKTTKSFRFHVNNSRHAGDHDDEYRTLTLHPDGTFTDYNEHLWDLKSDWVTEGVSRIVHGGTYELELGQIQLQYTKVVSKTNDVVTAKDEIAADEPLKEPFVTSATLSANGTSLTVKNRRARDASREEPQTLVAGGRHKIHGGKYS